MNNNEHVKLREYIERILDEREQARLEAAKVLDAHLQNLNHWREENLKDKEKFMSKEVYYAEHGPLVRRVENIETKYNKIVGVGIALVAGAGLLGAVVMHLLK